MQKRSYLSSYEIKKLLSSIKQDSYLERNYCMILMAFIHGLRVSELLSLKLSDIDLGGKTLNVRRMKNGFSTIHPLLREEIKGLNKWLSIRKKARYFEETDYLFISPSGKPLSRQQFYNILKNTGEIALLPVKTHPHMLRHACGYALADAGIDTRLIQDYLGHKNITHTVRYTASNSARFRGMWGNHFKTFCTILTS